MRRITIILAMAALTGCANTEQLIQVLDSAITYVNSTSR